MKYDFYAGASTKKTDADFMNNIGGYLVPEQMLKGIKESSMYFKYFNAIYDRTGMWINKLPEIFK